MKLLMCFECGDLFPLSLETQSCKCEAVSGEYREDRLHADIYMRDRRAGTVLGFANRSFKTAIREQMEYGDKTEEMIYCGQKVAPGREFTAFIIPESAPTIHYHFTG